jgi:hypothetical protein
MRSAGTSRRFNEVGTPERVSHPALTPADATGAAFVKLRYRYITEAREPTTTQNRPKPERQEQDHSVTHVDLIWSAVFHDTDCREGIAEIPSRRSFSTRPAIGSAVSRSIVCTEEPKFESGRTFQATRGVGILKTAGKVGVRSRPSLCGNLVSAPE